ncbi:Cystathionine gamma-lyase [Halotydeus destructor]|nr:Cystathionine gamma-lyase [Halotydeus destructor]
MTLEDEPTNGYSGDAVVTSGPATNGHQMRRKSSQSYQVTNGLISPTKDVHGTAELDFATRAIHVGQEPGQWGHRAVIPPICLATTFEQPAPAKPVQFEYGRSGNPTRNCLEQALAALESADYALVYSSGLAATTNIQYLLSPGDHVICGNDLYGGTNRFFRTCAGKFGIELSFVDASDPATVSAAIKPNTKLAWMETPTNPMMQLCDIEAIAAVLRAADHKIILTVDNTFMSPYLQNPLKQGADLVIHSASKYLNGHSDVIMGAIMTSNADLFKKLAFYQNSLGAVPSPFDCYLVNRSLKTLHLRMEAHNKNSLEVGHFLEAHPLIRKVLHPGLASHPQHDLHLRQCRGSSGTFSFYIEGTSAETELFVKSLRLFTLAESLGGVESLIEVPALMTHASVPAELRAQLGLDDTLVRVSVGVEAIDDLISDLANALQIVAKSRESAKTL